MSLKSPLSFLVASSDSFVLNRFQQLLPENPAKVEIATSLEAATQVLASGERPTLALLDANLRTHEMALTFDRLLAVARMEEGLLPLSIVLISDTVTENWTNRLAEGIIDDIVPRSADPAYWRFRLERVLQRREQLQELETFREAAALNEQLDRLTGVYNRETILSLLFRETDRVQRMNGMLSVLLLDLDDFGHWNTRLGNASCDHLLCQAAGRIVRMQRSYDLLGRPGKDEFLLILPGCSLNNALAFAERIRADVFGVPFLTGEDAIRLSCCIGIATSKSRSPMVVLREAEQALQAARANGPESIVCFGEQEHESIAPVRFLGTSAQE